MLLTGKKAVVIPACDCAFQGYLPIKLPAVKERSQLKIQLALIRDDGEMLSNYELALDVFPRSNSALGKVCALGASKAFEEKLCKAYSLSLIDIAAADKDTTILVFDLEQYGLCMRNEDLIRQMAENIVKWADENPQVDIISLWPYDGKHEQCCCERCKEHSKSVNYSYFVSRIEKLVLEKRPGIRLDRISYLDITECEDVSLSPNVIVNKAVWHEKLRTAGKPDGSCLADTEYEENILR